MIVLLRHVFNPLSSRRVAVFFFGLSSFLFLNAHCMLSFRGRGWSEADLVLLAIFPLPLPSVNKPMVTLTRISL